MKTRMKMMLKLEMKLEGAGANGGVQYRSHLHAPTVRTPPAGATEEMKKRMEESQALLQKHAKWNLTGYQADFDYGNRYTGQLYEQDTTRGIMEQIATVRRDLEQIIVMAAAEVEKNRAILGALAKVDADVTSLAEANGAIAR